MLILARSLKDLSFGQLMTLYEEGNLENATQLRPELSAQEKILWAEQEFYQYLRQVFFETPGAVYCIWETGGTYASALRLEPYQDGLLLEALETAPDLRNRGYASILLQEVTRWLEQRGSVKVYSHVSKKNAASLAVHEKCGFRRILEHAVYADGSVLRGSCTFCLEVCKKHP